MSNTSTGAAQKGSKYQMQRITSTENKHFLDELFNDNLEWISPREKDDFIEYRMNSPYLLRHLGINQSVKKTMINSFWPTPQPQWDGIAIGSNKTLYLIEAKSHLTEIVPGKPGNAQNDQLKYNSIMLSAKELFGIIDSAENREYWCKKYYQIGNRIAFAFRLKEIMACSSVYYQDVKLVFLNFVNDETWGYNNEMVKTAELWNSHYENVIFPQLKISKNDLTKKGIYIINFDLSKIK